MFSVKSIIAENGKTFYEYNSNKPIDIRPRIFATIAASVAFGYYLDRDFKDFLNGVITVQAILIGFSFSVMFFLMSSAAARSSGQQPPAGEASLEEQLRREKLDKISREIFHNVAYFNLVAMGCLCAALIILLPNNSDTVWNFLKYLRIAGAKFILTPYSIFLSVVQPLVRATFLFLLIESAFTFARTTGRVNYLFGKSL